MRRIVITVLAVLLTSSLATSSVAAVGGRTETRPYSIGRAQIHWNSQGGSFIGTQPETFTPEDDERRVTISLSSDTGLPVRGRVEINGHVVEFCSETTRPIRVLPGQELAISAIFGLCDGSFSLVTEGTITVTFSK